MRVAIVMCAALSAASCGRPDRNDLSRGADSGSPAAHADARDGVVAASRVAPATGRCGDETITEEGIGLLRIGASVESVRARCTVVRDTMVLDMEGMPARRVSVALTRDSVIADVVDGKVWRINIASPRLRTADSLGVGSSIDRLRRLDTPRILTGEGAFFLVSREHCGLSFRLANAGALRAVLPVREVPANAVVSQVLIVGCRPAGN